MTSTGIIKRISDLDKRIIPKKIREELEISKDQAFEFFIDKDEKSIKLIPVKEKISDRLKHLSEKLSINGLVVVHWQIAKELKEIAEEIEMLEK